MSHHLRGSKAVPNCHVRARSTMSTQSSATAALRHAEQLWQSDILVSDEYTSFATKQTTGGEVWGAARSLQACMPHGARTSD